MGSTFRMGLLVTSPSTKPVPLSSTSDVGLPPGVRCSERVNTLYFRRDHQGTTSGASFSFVAATTSMLSLSWPPPPRRSRLEHLCPVFVITTSTTTVSVAAAPAFVPHRFDPVPRASVVPARLAFAWRCPTPYFATIVFLYRWADTSRAVAAIVVQITNTVWTQCEPPKTPRHFILTHLL
ncbi:hypothetical protein C8R43DRAFT_1119781 [Mycena crocata]|nr:hypothetical protein C8R43DRAFT_1119781 [Mycena crocata]